MASITRSANGRRIIQFVTAEGSRKSIRLGKMSQRLAEEIRVKVEQLSAAQVAGFSPDLETLQWLGRIGAVLHARLAAGGLVGRRSRPKLEEFLEQYIKERTDIKPNTRRNLKDSMMRLLEFFGGDRELCSITLGDADAWLVYLRGNYASATNGGTVKRAKQFFRSAVRRKILSENPFHDLKPPPQKNDARRHFVTLDVAHQVLQACPDAEWQLLFALSRFGGLRCPSEHLGLKWADVYWEQGRFRVRSSKTQHLGGGDRWVPIFQELRHYLEVAFKQAEPGTMYVINRYRQENASLRKQFLRIMGRAGVAPWPRLFHNLRASRETELAAIYPLHVVCSWIGNSERIAFQHYLQVTDNYFAEACGSCLRQ